MIMEYLYGEFTDRQIEISASIMHGEVHKLLLYKDKYFEEKVFEDDQAFLRFFRNILVRYGGLNELLGEPENMVAFMSTLKAAYDEVRNPHFRFGKFRRLILDAHTYISAMFEEVDDDAKSTDS